jgi:hypothetical protein
MLQQWQNSIPEVTKTLGLILFILNCIFPSVGTFIMACITQPIRGDQIVVGVLQFLTVPLCFIGWIWSIWWGYLCYAKAKDDQILVGGTAGSNQSREPMKS